MTRHIHFRLLALSLVMLLASCGGGGGGSSSSSSAAISAPPVVTTPTALSAANRALFNDGVVLGRLLAGTLASNRTAVVSGSGSSITATVSSPCSSGTSGASATFVLTRDSADNVAGTVTYASFNGCFDMGLSGTATVSGVLVGNTFSRLTLTFDNLLVSRSPVPYRFSGTIGVTWTAAGYVATVNGSFKDGLTGTTLFRFDNYGLDVIVSAGGVPGADDLLLSGRLTNALLGATVDLLSSGRIRGLPGPAGFFAGTYLMQLASFTASVLYAGGVASFP